MMQKRRKWTDPQELLLMLLDNYNCSKLCLPSLLQTLKKRMGQVLIPKPQTLPLKNRRVHQGLPALDWKIPGNFWAQPGVGRIWGGVGSHQAIMPSSPPPLGAAILFRSLYSEDLLYSWEISMPLLWLGNPTSCLCFMLKLKASVQPHPFFFSFKLVLMLGKSSGCAGLAQNSGYKFSK